MFDTTLELPDAARRLHVDYLRAAQNADGGFSGRRGTSDVYYTSFALRSLAMLGALDEPIAQDTARYLCDKLKEHRNRPLPGVDFLALAMSDVILRATTSVDVFGAAGRELAREVVEFTDPFRRDDGGYAKTPRSGQSSTYFTFLVLLVREMVGVACDTPSTIVDIIRGRQREDGGFVELGPLPHGGTNPTAAAVGTLVMLDNLDSSTAETAAGFLASMQVPGGGLRANARVPIADLLSTYTGLVALDMMATVSRLDLVACRKFVDSLAQPTGGFTAGVFDDAADIEYTYYGLASLGLLNR